MSNVNTFLLSESAKLLTWQQWKRMGGCGLSDCTLNACLRSMKRVLAPLDTLGSLQSHCIVAGREIARFAKINLNKPDMAIPEYVNGVNLADARAEIKTLWVETL